MAKLWISIGTFIVAILTLLVEAAPAAAANKTGQFAVEGAGAASCASFVEAKQKKTGNYERFIGYVEGYLTAANRYEPNTFDLSPWHNSNALALILDHYCKSNPKDALVIAAQRMVVSFMPLRLADFSPMIEVGDAKSRTAVYQQILKRAQSALHRRGLYSGAEDGKFSPQLSASLAQFQRSAKLNPTGVPDNATLWTLLNP